MSKIIRLPQHGWTGSCKKIEIRDENIIRKTFEYADLIGTDFTEAIRRALTIALPLIIQNELAAQARLAACFSESIHSITSTPNHQVKSQQIPTELYEESGKAISPPKIYSSSESANTNQPPSRPIKSGGHLI